MNRQELLKRYSLFFIGLFLNSFGVSFVTKANLGTSPISSIPYTLSLAFTPTLGMFTLYMSILLIVAQMIMLGRNFPKQYFLQIPISILFSWFIDLTMKLLSFMDPGTYLLQFFSLILGCAILGLGIYLEMLADVAMLPGEMSVKVFTLVFHKDFGKTKVAVDSSFVIIAGVISFALFHKIAGVREGTVVAALLVGMTARFLKRKLAFVETMLFGNSNEVNSQRNKSDSHKFTA